MMRETDGWDRPLSRPAREKLPVRATRENNLRAARRSAIWNMDISYSSKAATAPISDERSLVRRRHGERQKDHIMSLKEKLDALRAAKDEGRIFPPEVVALMHKSTAELAASGQVERALKAGDLAPSFVLPDATGALVSSHDLL